MHSKFKMFRLFFRLSFPPSLLTVRHWGLQAHLLLGTVKQLLGVVTDKTQ